MKLDIKNTVLCLTVSLLFIVSFNNVFGENVIDGNSIHTNIYELKIKSSPPGLPIDGSGMYEGNSKSNGEHMNLLDGK